MKTKSMFVTAVLWILTAFASYLFFSIWFWIGNSTMSYREILGAGGQLAGWVLLYWWLPGIFIAADRHKWND